MSIRALAYVLLAAFALLSSVAGLWQLADSRKKVMAAEWVQSVNRLSDLAQRSSAQLAKERGVTAAILGDSGAASPAMKADMMAARAAVDGLYREFAALAEHLAVRAPAHPLLGWMTRLERTRRETERFRARLDEQLLGVPNGLVAEIWIGLINDQIEQLHGFSAIAMLPLDGNDYTHTSVPIIKDLLFTLSEHLGRERAIVGVAIARGVPLGVRELETLAEYGAIARQAKRRIDAIVEHLATTDEIERARAAFSRDLLERYEALRTRVFESSAAALPYPVDAEEWYRETTVGIDAVLGLAQAISTHFERDIGRLSDQAARTRSLLLVIFLSMLALFCVAVQVLRRRVLRPLAALEEAAATIARGELSRALPPLPDDELGRLGKSFEHMREALLRDVERRERDAGQLRKFKSLIEQSASAMVVTDPDGVVEYVNGRFETVTGYAPDEAIGCKAGFWRSDVGAPVLQPDLWETVGQGRVWEGEFINRRKNGELYWASVMVSPVGDDSGRVSHFIGILNDISERRSIEDRLNFLTNYDELTVLPNRSLLELRFAAAREEACRSGTPIGIVAFGLSRFERINDGLGRDVGDRILREFALRLSQFTRRGDTVSRHGGTEFAMLVTGLRGIDHLCDLLEPIMEGVNMPFMIEGDKLQPIVRAGISVLPDDGDSLDILLRKATIALHHGERQGLDHCVYAEELDRNARERLSIENALRRALERDELELHYQPKVDLATGRTVGMEALVRWRHEETGEYVSPQRFIPIAEECGLIEHLGAWVLRQACVQNRAWLEAGLPRMVVAVNLSAVQLRQPGLPEMVAEVLAETGLEPPLLEVELTESALMECPEQANTVLSRLKGLGLRLSIDDFGTGYSSLAYLSRFPVDQLKIDASFVREVTTDATAAAISTSVIALAHQMGLRVIAEGVETEEQIAFLMRHGCDEIQGYYYSRPVTASAFAVLMASDKRLVLPDISGRQRTLLVVDDEPAVLAMISLALEREALRVLTARTAREGLELLASNEVQVVLADERMPEMSGTAFLECVKRSHPETVRLALSGYADAESIVRMVNSGAIYKFFTKPWDAAHLRAQILDAFVHQETQRARAAGADLPERPLRVPD